MQRQPLPRPGALPRPPTSPKALPRCARCAALQVRFLARGAYGFVLQALDRFTGLQVACKFIERGGQVGGWVGGLVEWLGGPVQGKL